MAACVAVLAAVLAVVAPATPAAAASVPGPNIATLAEGLSNPQGVAVDGAGNTYIADTSANRVMKADPSGVVTLVAGNGTCCFSGDGGPATEAQVRSPIDVALDAAGNLYIADDGRRVRKVDTSGIITTFAGIGFNPPPPNDGDGGQATAARILPAGLVFDDAGNLYIAERFAYRIRKIDTSGIITTIAGIGTSGFSGDGGLATGAQFNEPRDVAFDGDDNLYIADTQNARIRKIEPSGIITTFAGGGAPPDGNGDGGTATDAVLGFTTGVAVDGEGNVFISESGRIRRVDTSGIITSFAGGGSPPDGIGDGGPALEASFNNPERLALDSIGNLFIVDNQHHRIRLVGALSIAKGDIPEPVPAGGLLTYNLTVGNFSGVAAKATMLTDTLPAGTTFVSVSTTKGTCAEAGGVVTCALGTLAARSGAKVTVKVNAPSSPGPVTNVASFTADHPDLIVLDDAASEETVVTEAALALTKVGTPDPVRVNGKLTYKLNVFNGLSTPATGVVVTDSLPASFSLISAASTVGSCSEAGGLVTCDLGTLPYQGTAKVTLAVRPTQAGIFTNTATVHSIEAPGPVLATTETRVSAGAECGRVISADTTLTEDIGPCGFTDGVIIGASGITLDLGGHRIFGFPGPGDGTKAGILMPNHSHVTVRNGTVSDFDAGVVIDGGGSNTVSDLNVHDNIGRDDAFESELGDGIVVFDSPGNRIAHNTVVRNGIFDGIGILGDTSDDNVIEHNTVEDNVGPSDEGPAGQGIIVSSFTGDLDAQVINRVRVADNVVRRNGSAGISNFNNVQGQVLRNTVEDNGFTNSQGNGIGMQVGFGAADAGIATRMLVKANKVHGNAWDGIQVGGGARNNRVLNNDAAGNALMFPDFFKDLTDQNSSCDNNTWSGNTWGMGGFDPPCVTTGGSGPGAPLATSAAALEEGSASSAGEPPDATPIARRLRR